MTPPTLPEFILARVAEDEELAREAAADRGLPDSWTAAYFDYEGISLLEGPTPYSDPDPAADHMTRWNTARVLAQCAAIRAVVELHTPDDPENEPATCARCAPVHSGYRIGATWPCLTLRHLAAIWADHADYRKEWAA